MELTWTQMQIKLTSLIHFHHKKKKINESMKIENEKRNQKNYKKLMKIGNK